jgi:acyl carrier protein
MDVLGPPIGGPPGGIVETTHAEPGPEMTSYRYIADLLVKKYDVKPDAIDPGATLTDLGLDSLGIAELMFDVGDEYGIDIPDERMEFTTLGEAVALVDEFVHKKGV